MFRETSDSPSLLAKMVFVFIFYGKNFLSDFELSSFNSSPLSTRIWVHFSSQNFSNSLKTHSSFESLVLLQSLFSLSSQIASSYLILAMFESFLRTKIFFFLFWSSKSWAPWHEACNTPTDNINKKNSFTNSELFCYRFECIWVTNTLNDERCYWLAMLLSDERRLLSLRGYVLRQWFYARFYVCLSISTYVVVFTLTFSFTTLMLNSLIEKSHFLSNGNGECFRIYFRLLSWLYLKSYFRLR